MRQFILLALALCVGPFSAFAESTDTTQVVRVHTSDEALIQQFGRRHEHMIVDRAKGVIVMEADATDLAMVAAAGLRHEVDIEATEAMHRPLLRSPGQDAGIPGFACYRTVAETKTRLDQLAALYPSLASVIDIGDSWEKSAAQPGGGEDLRVLRLTNTSNAGDKPKLFLMGSIHAREYTPAELVLRFAEWLLTNYGIDADATWILDHQEVHLLVHANPDARKKAEAGQSWRKNTNTAYCGTTSVNRGADLNRNWPFKWGAATNGDGSSTNPCEGTFRGPMAASEPETAGTVAYVRSLYPDRRGDGDNDPAPLDTQGLFFDLHSFSGLVLWSWGWNGNGVAPNSTQLETLGRRFAWFNGYTPEPITGLYPTDGTTADTVYGELGVASYSFELGSAFFQDCASFENAILPKNLSALIYAAKTARAPYQWPAGPEALTIGVVPDLAVSGENISISAVIDDTHFSNTQGGAQTAQPIAAAHAWIATAPWQPGAIAIPMAAGDGTFNAPSEAVSASVASGALTPGKTLIYLQGRDTLGNDGPVSAAFVDVHAASAVGTLSGVVRSALDGQAIAGAQIAAGNWRSTSLVDGSYVRRLPAGSYSVNATATGFEPLSIADVTVAGTSNVTRDLALFALCHRLNENAESGIGMWTASTPWAITAGNTTQTGSRAWTDSPAGNYAANANTSLISPTIDLGGYENAELSFDSWCDTESGFDFGRVEISSNGGSSWSEVFRCNGDASLRRVRIALPALNNAAQARIRFRFSSDTGVQRDGWYVDNITLDAGGPICRATQTGGDAVFANGFE
jgi:carboxypeptidase T